jgi:hypothetical protein
MRPVSDVRRAQALVEAGVPLLTIANELGIARATIRDWRDSGFERVIAERQWRHPEFQRRDPLGTHLDVGPPGSHRCVAEDLARASPGAYAYLLGQYLGDGTISRGPRSVYRLRIFCCSDYPGIIGRVVAACRLVLPRSVHAYRTPRMRMVIVLSHWKHMRCFFPQDGPGKKHERFICLDDWQNRIVVAHPRPFLRGLIESDGCRTINRVNGGEYPRYMFTNRSEEIRRMFIRTAEQLDLRWTTANRWTVAISKRPDVAYLDSFIGPKW